MLNKLTLAIKTVSPVKMATIALATMMLVTGCDSDSLSEIAKEIEDEIKGNTPFTLNFAAKSAGDLVVCNSVYDNFGSADDGLNSISISDLRFYISNVKFYDADNKELTIELDDNDFQRNSDQGFVGLVDLTSNTSGACADEALGGTERTNASISGTLIAATLADGTAAKVSFDVGVPQAVMKDVIATNSQEDAPTPLNEMYWSWASGYRHLVMNFTIENSAEEAGKGLVHIGSRNCGGDGLLALEEKDSCDEVNTPTVSFTNFDLANDTIVLDIDELLKNVQFSASGGDEVVPTVACHSSPMQADCAAIFENIGLDITDGTADADTNSVFTKE
ncbi:MbnP family copper-binding protein [Colwellia echini]|uniref:Metallo-mystery pair system four-Cys motif protein n=1 Tax=Colwellia echini TaxID=1982103 RepID=A0ABY3MY62_9GAMM|nr:MbnP family copper-binding protein [Colwellia echini]TYK66119.1 metallo-mystery pair system four-Cys motif protein [Colwellia echini]